MTNKEKAIKKITDAFKKAGHENCVNIYKGDVFVNCNDTQAIRIYDDGSIKILSISGSRYSYPHIKSVDDFIQTMLIQVKKTIDDINSEYHQIWHALRKNS